MWRAVAACDCRALFRTDLRADLGICLAQRAAVLPVASVKQGAVLLQACPPLGLRRYTRIVYRVGTAALTAGKFDAFVSIDVQRNIARPSGFTVA